MTLDSLRGVAAMVVLLYRAVRRMGDVSGSSKPNR